jgi:hypothetical protein
LTSGLSDSVLFVRDAAGELRALDVDLPHQMLGAVIRLADPVGRKGVGLRDIRPRLKIGAMDRLRHLGLGQRQDVVIALLVVGQAQRAGIIGFRKLPVLDLGAERPVRDQDALGGFAQEGVAYGHVHYPVIPAKAGISCREGTLRLARPQPALG